ncbi:MAG TPA: molybdate ABC transporter substrate-binding protein [Rhizobacter sp.]|nr:molybdate ABC transporter substrate-binding protein [Rhizobacter sp.]
MHIKLVLRTLQRFGVAVALCGVLAAQAADLTVSAAASLNNAFKELGTAYEAQNPGTKVLFNFAASDALLAQIAKGAPADVFASADQETMDKAQAQKLLATGTRTNFASNTLVLAVPIDSKLQFTRISDLAQPGVKRFAIGNPASVPAGRYAKAALDAASHWGVIESRAVMALNVRQALDYVARGEVDVAFVYATDAATQKDKVKVAAVVPTPAPISYPIAALAGGPNPAEAARFVAFVASPQGQAVLARHGFGKP